MYGFIDSEREPDPPPRAWWTFIRHPGFDSMARILGFHREREREREGNAMLDLAGQKCLCTRKGLEVC